MEEDCAEGELMKIEEIKEILETIIDPETKMNVVEMNFVKDIKFSDGVISLTFRPPSFTCPVAIPIAVEIKKKLLTQPEVEDVQIEVVNYIKPKMIEEILAKIDKQSLEK